MNKDRLTRDYISRIGQLHDVDRVNLIKAIASDFNVDFGENNLVNEIRNDFHKDLNQVKDVLDKLEILLDVLNELDLRRSEIIVDRLAFRWQDDF